MKSLLFIITLMVSICSYGQEIEILQPQKVNKDPMKGLESGILWVGKHISIYEADNSTPVFTLGNSKHIFVKGITRIGYYSDSDSLLYMAQHNMKKISEDGQRLALGVTFANDSIPYAVYSDDKFVMKKAWAVLQKDLLRWLKENDGYLRVVTPIYGGRTFDVRFKLAK